MWTRYVRIVPSSEVTGLSLSGEIALAFDRIRERAQEIYDNRGPDSPGTEFQDWLQAERELFEVPDVHLEYDDQACRLFVSAEVLAERPLSILVEPGLITVLGHRMADGELCLFRRINLPDPIDPERARMDVQTGGMVKIVLAKPGAPEPPAEEQIRTMAAAAAG